ncbi:delta-12-fatty acid desaturase [Leucosporidium creatinivorum]|uniref:Delta-12-fatty acid desaturase n=1 Tax=Leucosporidium creatinivorum TaxID=106004 RepID=A0A1Y2FBK9_9BASI|nr:delta-12-fatty acid desaturase [Leucosporidium creatinivorum]
MDDTATLRQRIAPTSKQAASNDKDPSEELSHGVYPPFKLPRYTMKDLLGAVPAHCFERSAVRSLYYVARDAAMIAGLAFAASWVEAAFGAGGLVKDSTMLKWGCWSVYWMVQGVVFLGVLILGHECGHGAFSTSKRLNNHVGLVLHSFCLVPYYSWKISHARHHAATGHMTREEVFVSASRSEKLGAEGKSPPKSVEVDGEWLDELLEDAPMYRLGKVVLQQLLGWPAYLLTNVTSQPSYPPGTNHFNPDSALFEPRHRTLIHISNAGLLTMVGLLTLLGRYVGFAGVVKFYFVPYLIMNHWFVLITYLQHTDPMLPHYRGGEWTFARGTLCTIDRSVLGFVGTFFLHHISNTHVAHHVSSKIPHYHAAEATVALKAFLGDDYTSTSENVYLSLWRNLRFVEDEGEVLFYKDAYGRTSRKVKLEDSPSDSGVEVD